MHELDHYEAAIHTYEGVGVVLAEDGTEVDVYFDARQLQSGGIIVACMARGGVVIPREAKAVRGVTTDLESIQIEGNRTNLHCSSGGQVPLMVYAFSQMRLSHGYPGWPIEIVTAAFTNFVFDVREIDIFPDPVETAFRGYRVLIEPVNDYVEVYSRLRAAGGILQTATVTITRGTEEAIAERDIPELLFALSHPLSLARSTRVSWLWYKASSTTSAGEPRPQHTYHTGSVVMPFTTKGIFQGLHSDVPTLIQAWGTDNAARLFPLDDVVPRIAQYLDAARDGGFAETAALTSSTLLDVLANHYAVMRQRTALIREDVWTQYLAPELRKALAEILERFLTTGADPEPVEATISRMDAINVLKCMEKSQREALGNRLDGVWRTSFRSRLRRLLKDLGITCDFTDDVLATRNRLVHDARFATADTNLELAQLLWLAYACLLRLVDPEITLPQPWFAEKRRIAVLLRTMNTLQRATDGESVTRDQLIQVTHWPEAVVDATLAVCRLRGYVERVQHDRFRLTLQGSAMTSTGNTSRVP